MTTGAGYEIYGTPATPPKECVQFDPGERKWVRAFSIEIAPIETMEEALLTARDAKDDDLESVRVLSYNNQGLALIIAEF